jgi:chromosome segregation ATPase
MIPVTFWIKFIAIALVVASVVGMGWTIKHQYNKIQELDVQVRLEKEKSKELLGELENQNKSIIESNAKYEEVQKQLDKANSINKEIRTEFRRFRDVLNRKPVPATCEEAKTEMLEVGKELGKKWQR